MSQSRPIFTAPAIRPEVASARARRSVTFRRPANSRIVRRIGVSMVASVYRVRNSYLAGDCTRGMIKSTPKKLTARGTDWRFLNELKKEVKA
jgi:hypothetical protein